MCEERTYTIKGRLIKLISNEHTDLAVISTNRHEGKYVGIGQLIEEALGREVKIRGGRNYTVEELLDVELTAKVTEK